jgi:hypothetical protein
VEWKPVELAMCGKKITLPFDEEFFITGYELDGGHIPDGNKGLWRLESDVDSGFMLVFGYQLSKEGNVGKIDSSIWGSQELMRPVSSGRSKNFSCVNQVNVYTTPPMRVIVCVSWVCCKARSDWDPANAILMARFFPQTLVMTNFEMRAQTAHAREQEGIRGEINIVRAEHATHWGGDSMHHCIEPFLFTETNSYSRAHSLGKLAYWTNKVGYLIAQGWMGASWDGLFDYYDVDPWNSSAKKAEYVVVDPSKGRRELRGKVDFNNDKRKKNVIFRALGARLDALDVLTDYDPTDRPDDLIVKTPRQGDYDNLHMAAPMRAPPDFAKLKSKQQREDWGLEKIIMSPLCVHDCIHTHWRWNDGYSSKSNLGWGLEGPYTVPGAPMVPMNQKVVIKLLKDPRKDSGEVGFSVRAHIQPQIVSGEWSVINYNGSGFPVYVKTSAGNAGKIRERFRGWWGDDEVSGKDISQWGWLGLLVNGKDIPQEDWWGFFWYLRYFSDGKKKHERVRIKNLAGARDG